MKKFFALILAVFMVFGALAAFGAAAKTADYSPGGKMYASAAALKGDLDGDGLVAVNDYLILKSYLKGLICLSESLKYAADMNGDGIVSSADVLVLKSCLKGMPLPPQGDLSIDILDVGQGDCIFIVLPNGKTVLIDAGNSYNANFIINYIQSKGKSAIDHVIVTHPHADHIGAMEAVIRAFDVKNLYMTKATTTTVTFERLLDAIGEKGLSVQTAKAGVTLFDFGNLKAEFVAPNKNSYGNINNFSAVLLLSYNERRFLFSGDAEQESEAEILAAGYNISADVLKVGHHGSHTASTQNYITAVSPSAAVISVGKNNTFDHPREITLATLNSFGARIWRTDEDGTVAVVCDGVNITVNGLLLNGGGTPPEDTSSEAASSEEQGIIVYITATGTKYHLESCSSLSQSKIPVLLSELNTDKYSPCSVCKPPVK